MSVELVDMRMRSVLSVRITRLDKEWARLGCAKRGTEVDRIIEEDEWGRVAVRCMIKGGVVDSYRSTSVGQANGVHGCSTG